MLEFQEGHTAKRTCLGCFQIREKYSLIRFVVQTKTKTISIDPYQTECGRGSYICPDFDCLSKLQKSKRFKKFTVAISQTNKNIFLCEVGKMIQSDKIFSLAGLAKRAGKLGVGAQAVETAIKKRQAKLVILAEDTASNTKNHFLNLITKFERKFIVYGKKDDWGKLFAKENVTVTAILNDQFARAIRNEFDLINRH